MSDENKPIEWEEPGPPPPPRRMVAMVLHHDDGAARTWALAGDDPESPRTFDEGSLAFMALADIRAFLAAQDPPLRVVTEEDQHEAETVARLDAITAERNAMWGREKGYKERIAELERERDKYKGLSGSIRDNFDRLAKDHAGEVRRVTELEAKLTEARQGAVVVAASEDDAATVAEVCNAAKGGWFRLRPEESQALSRATIRSAADDAVLVECVRRVLAGGVYPSWVRDNTNALKRAAGVEG